MIKFCEKRKGFPQRAIWQSEFSFSATTADTLTHLGCRLKQKRRSLCRGPEQSWQGSRGHRVLLRQTSWHLTHCVVSWLWPSWWFSTGDTDTAEEKTREEAINPGQYKWEKLTLRLMNDFYLETVSSHQPKQVKGSFKNCLKSIVQQRKLIF